MSKATAGQSMCHQMIMGAGKTTVVAPTLGLLLADGQRLVMEVRHRQHVSHESTVAETNACHARHILL